MKKIYLLLMVAVAVVSCQNNASQQDKDVENSDSTNTELAEYPNVDINEFDSLVDNYIDKTISIEGTCIHICKHGGAKMHIVGDNADNRVIIFATDESGKFSPDMEGNKYRVIGKVVETRIDSAYLAQWEADILADEEGIEKPDSKLEHHEEEDVDKAMQVEMKLAQIDELRKEIAESEKGYLSDIKIDCISYEQIK